MNIVLVEAPEVTPVSLEEIYSFLRLDPDGSPPSHPDDAMLTDMLKSATEKVEALTRRALVQQTIRMVLPSFGPVDAHSGIELFRPPFIEFVSVSYLDSAGDEQTLDPDSYTVSADAIVPKLYPTSAWPSSLSNRDDAVRIEYVVGYAPVDSSDLTGNIPASLKAAVKFEVQLQYDELTPEKRAQIEATVLRLVGQYRVYSF